MPNKHFTLTLLGTSVKLEEVAVDRHCIFDDKVNGSDYGIAESLSFVSSLIDDNSRRVKEPLADKVYYEHTLNDKVAVIEGVSDVGSEVYDRIALGVNKILEAVADGCTNITIQGFSRGAVEALLIAHEIDRIQKLFKGNKPSDKFMSKIYPQIFNSPCKGTQKELKKHLKCNKMNTDAFFNNLANINLSVSNIDPVPGTGPGITWWSDRFTQVPEIVNDYRQVVMKHEVSPGFQAIIPTPAPPAPGKKYSIAVYPGQHGTGTGNFRDQAHKPIRVADPETGKPTIPQTQHVQELIVLNQLLFLKEHGVAFKGSIDPRFDSLNGCSLKVQFEDAKLKDNNLKINSLVKKLTSGYTLTTELNKQPKLSYYDHITKNTIEIEFAREDTEKLKELFLVQPFYQENASEAALKTILQITNHKRSETNLIRMVKEFLDNQDTFKPDAEYLRIYDAIVENKHAYEYFLNTSYINGPTGAITTGPVRRVFHKDSRSVLLTEVVPNYSNPMFLNEHHAELKVKKLLNLDPDITLPNLIKNIITNLVTYSELPSPVNGSSFDESKEQYMKFFAAKETQKIIKVALSTIINQLSQGYLDDAVADKALSAELFKAVGFAFDSLNGADSQICKDLYNKLYDELTTTIDRKHSLLIKSAHAILAEKTIEKPVSPDLENNSNTSIESPRSGRDKEGSPVEEIAPIDRKINNLLNVIELFDKIEKFSTDLDTFSTFESFLVIDSIKQKKTDLSNLLSAVIQNTNLYLEQHKDTNNDIFAPIYTRYKEISVKYGHNGSSNHDTANNNNNCDDELTVPQQEQSEQSATKTPVAQLKSLVLATMVAQRWKKNALRQEHKSPELGSDSPSIQDNTDSDVEGADENVPSSFVAIDDQIVQVGQKDQEQLQQQLQLEIQQLQEQLHQQQLQSQEQQAQLLEQSQPLQLQIQQLQAQLHQQQLQSQQQQAQLLQQLQLQHQDQLLKQSQPLQLEIQQLQEQLQSQEQQAQLQQQLQLQHQDQLLEQSQPLQLEIQQLQEQLHQQQLHAQEQQEQLQQQLQLQHQAQLLEQSQPLQLQIQQLQEQLHQQQLQSQGQQAQLQQQSQPLQLQIQQLQTQLHQQQLQAQEQQKQLQQQLQLQHQAQLLEQSQPLQLQIKQLQTQLQLQQLQAQEQQEQLQQQLQLQHQAQLLEQSQPLQLQIKQLQAQLHQQQLQSQEQQEQLQQQLQLQHQAQLLEQSQPLQLQIKQLQAQLQLQQLQSQEQQEQLQQQLQLQHQAQLLEQSQPLQLQIQQLQTQLQLQQLQAQQQQEQLQQQLQQRQVLDVQNQKQQLELEQQHRQEQQKQQKQIQEQAHQLQQQRELLSKQTEDLNAKQAELIEKDKANLPLKDNSVIRHLRQETNAYRNHLIDLAEHIDPEIDLEKDLPDDSSEELKIIKSKHDKINDLLTILNDKQKPSADLRVKDFRHELTENAYKVLAEHRDQWAMRWIKNIFVFLGIIGTGIVPYLAYTCATNKSPLFFIQTDGEQFADKALEISDDAESDVSLEVS